MEFFRKKNCIPSYSVEVIYDKQCKTQRKRSPTSLSIRTTKPDEGSEPRKNQNKKLVEKNLNSSPLLVKEKISAPDKILVNIDSEIRFIEKDYQHKVELYHQLFQKNNRLKNLLAQLEQTILYYQIHRNIGNENKKSRQGSIGSYSNNSFKSATFRTRNISEKKSTVKSGILQIDDLEGLRKVIIAINRNCHV
jgi:hypothetical protein